MANVRACEHKQFGAWQTSCLNNRVNIPVKLMFDFAEIIKFIGASSAQFSVRNARNSPMGISTSRNFACVLQTALMAVGRKTGEGPVPQVSDVVPGRIPRSDDRVLIPTGREAPNTFHFSLYA